MPVVGLQLFKLYRKRKPAAISRNITKAKAGTRSAYGATDRPIPRRLRSNHDTGTTSAVVEWRLEDAGNGHQARNPGPVLR